MAGHGIYLAAKAQLAQLLLQHAWDKTRRGEGIHRPWLWADTHPVARLRVPSLDIDQIVLAGASGRTLAFGPGHLPGTAPPGRAGLSVISGHRDSHFRFLAALRDGADVHVHRPDGAIRRYVVEHRMVIDLATERLDLDPLADRLVLVTCYPFRDWSAGGTQRYVVSLAPSP